MYFIVSDSVPLIYFFLAQTLNYSVLIKALNYFGFQRSFNISCGKFHLSPNLFLKCILSTFKAFNAK